MGRRALRKINPAVDLSRHLIGLEGGWSAAEVFGRSAPLEVEVGSGKGLFLLRAATARPDRDFLGIELAERYARFAAARLARADVPNARVASADALKIFHEVFSPSSIAAVHVYFPDPWWKKRHRKRRVMNDVFLRDVERVLLPGGELHFWTDVAEYFEDGLRVLQSTSLEGPMPVAEIPAEHELDYHTHFERRTRLKELPVYRALLRKKKDL